MSEEHKEKIRIANLGKTRSPATTFKKGHKFSAETIEKMRRTCTGKPCKTKGEKSNLWKGGITPIMQYLRTCLKYKQWRADVFSRDNFTCVFCGSRSGNGKAVILNADHIKPFYLILAELKMKDIENAMKCEELWDTNNGRTLCRDCHKTTGTWGRPKNKK